MVSSLIWVQIQVGQWQQSFAVLFERTFKIISKILIVIDF